MCSSGIGAIGKRSTAPKSSPTCVSGKITVPSASATRPVVQSTLDSVNTTSTSPFSTSPPMNSPLKVTVFSTLPTMRAGYTYCRPGATTSIDSSPIAMNDAIELYL